jgi:ABC-type lipoprotein release transport system permease subunit
MALDAAVKPVAQRKAVLRPLAPVTYLLRNWGRTIPLTSVIVLAVLLISGIISLINSIPLSIRTIYSYSRRMVAVTPRGDPELVPAIYERVKREAPVEMERLITARGTSAQVQSIVGKWQFVVFGLKPDDMRYLLQRYETRGIKGRLPEIGKAEAIVSEPVARNLGLKLGSTLLDPKTPENYSPMPVKVVGIANSTEWFMLNDYTYQQLFHFPKVDAVLAFATNDRDQEKLDRWAYNTFKGERAQVFAYFRLQDETEKMFSTLFLILNVVIGMLVLVITLMMGMLMNIYQSQRLVEFGLLQAMGYTKRQLVRRVFLESIVVLLLGWILGVIVSYGFLELANKYMMAPKAYALSTRDLTALAYTAPVPIAILVVATMTIYFRFRKFDPVAVVERRLV